MRFLKLILFTFPALMLCMGAFYIPAYAASAAPPSTLAWITGDILHIEVRGGQQGVEAAFINDARVNYRVDGRLELPAAGYAGTERYISVYAVDFAGNQSNTVQLLNPFYVPPAATPTPVPATPMPTAAPTPVPATPAPTPAATAPPPFPSPEPEPTAAPVYTVTHTPITTYTEEPQTAPVVEESNPFTPPGEGEVLDDANEQDGKEFMTITTESGGVFYLVVDRQRDADNVYLLNTVTEQDLMAIAEKNGQTAGGVSAVPAPEPTAAPEPTPTPPPEPETPGVPAKGNSGMLILVAVVVIAVGGIGYYFKIVKGKEKPADAGDGEYEDEYGYDDETESGGDSDDSEDNLEDDSEEEQE